VAGDESAPNFLRAIPSNWHYTTMPREPRVVATGLPHHIAQRGNARQDVFTADPLRRTYLELLAEHAAANRLRIQSYLRLMTNHVHIVALPETRVVVRKKCDPSLSRLLFQAKGVVQTAENRFRCNSMTDWQLVSMDRLRSAGLD
jgi:REP element-mobilizing transposase RayT